MNLFHSGVALTGSRSF